MKKLLLFVLTISSVFASFTTLSTQDVEKEIKNNTILIDIRRADEFKKYGVIATSHKLTFFDEKGQHNVPKWMNTFTNIVPNKDTKFILVCAHANRTKVVGNFLSKQLGYKNVYELKGGINYGWIDKGRKTVK
jgi:rhodanese-related sulfurtransferase